MRAESIHKYLKEKGYTYTIIAETIGVSPSHVRNVAEGIFTSHRVASAISTAIDKPLIEVFPDYEGKGVKERKISRRKAVAALKKKIASVS